MAASLQGSSPNKVKGSPMVEFAFPLVLWTLIEERAAATISFVVVLPTLPVIPMKGMLNFSRNQRPVSRRAASVSSTSMAAASPISAGSSCPFFIKKALAPSFTTWGMNLWASTLSPIIGTKSTFLKGRLWVSLEFVKKPFISVSPFPFNSFPLAAFNMSFTVTCINTPYLDCNAATKNSFTRSCHKNVVCVLVVFYNQISSKEMNPHLVISKAI